MKPRTLRVFCMGCADDKIEMDVYLDEDFGEAFGCRKCGITVSVNFDKNSIEVDAKRVANEI